MGITTKTVQVCTCDICQKECSASEGTIKIKVKRPDRDVGRSYIFVTLQYYSPYVCDNGIVCDECKDKYLQQYVKTI